MKFIRIAGVCAAVICVIGLSLAAVSDALASAGPFANEIAVLTKQGISPARAAQALDVQGKVARANLVSEVQAATGKSYAGAWFEPATAQVHVGVASEASGPPVQRAVANAGVEGVVALTPVRSTWAALIAVQNHWDQILGEVLRGQGWTTGLDARRNAVSVTLGSSTPPDLRALLEREAALASVNVFVHTAPPSRFQAESLATCKFAKFGEAYCEKTLVSGVGIAPETTEPLCTAGPMLVEEEETYMLTAGHCFGVFETEGVVAGSVTSAYPEKEPKQKEIGKEGKWMYTTDRDMAEVKISGASSFRNALPTPLPALMAEWGREELSQGVIGEAANMKGEANCHEGMTSKEQCGKVELMNVTVENNKGQKAKHLVEDTACGENGDSGGPFFFSESKANNVHMQGMLVKGNPEKKCSEGGKTTWYYPLKEEGVEGQGILATFAGQHVLTKANETREKDPGQEFAAVPRKASITSETTKLVLKAGKNKVTCTKGKDSGRLSSQRTFTKIVVTLTGCKSEGEGAKACAVKSKGAAAEEIKTNSLKGELGEVESKELTAVLLQPEVTAEGFATLEKNECTAETKLTGGLIGEVTPTNKVGKAVKFEFKAEKEAQELREFETASDVKSEKEITLTAFGLGATAETSDTNTFEEEVEVKSGE